MKIDLIKTCQLAFLFPNGCGSFGIVQKHLVTVDSIMIGYERVILKRLCHSQAKMEQGSPLCETHNSVKDNTTWALEHCKTAKHSGLNLVVLENMDVGPRSAEGSAAYAEFTTRPI